MAKVTGIGGVFFKSKMNNKELTKWYQKHLGLELEDFGGSILQWEKDQAEDKGLTVWNIAAQDSEWFGPSKANFMINYRVDDLEQMMTDLKASSVEVVQEIQKHENGKFAWILDPDGNKLELWEPMLWDDKNKQ
jgi:predicted enzyme related to lactoylglutathione lyase